MAERFNMKELAALAAALGYELREVSANPSRLYELVPTEAARFHEAGLDVPPVHRQSLDEYGIYSKLAFAIERFVAELMSRIRDRLDRPEEKIDGSKLVGVAKYLLIAEEYLTPTLGWTATFEMADSLMSLAKRLHAAEIAVKGG